MDIIEYIGRKLHDLCQSKNLILKQKMFTNGYLLNKKNIQLLDDLRTDWLQIPIDGAKDYHDSRRYAYSDQKIAIPTYNKIMDNLELLVECSKLKTAIRVNVDKRNAEGISHLLDDLVTRNLHKTDQIHVSFAYVSANTPFNTTMGDICFKSIKEFSKIQIKLMHEVLNRGIRVRLFPGVNYGTCMAVRKRSFSIGPHGEVWKCIEESGDASSQIGFLKNGTIQWTNTELRDQWMRWQLDKDRACLSCHVLPNCMGGCIYPVVHSETARSSNRAINGRCTPLRFNIEGLLKIHEQQQQRTQDRVAQ